jgi:hypothetical protein
MRIAVIGAGAIGRYVAEGLRRDGMAPAAILVRSGPPDEPVGGYGFRPLGRGIARGHHPPGRLRGPFGPGSTRGPSRSIAASTS